MKAKLITPVLSVALAAMAHAETLRLTRADYADRAHAAWIAQMAAVFIGFPFEHHTASVEWLSEYPQPYQVAAPDDDWYYEMSALRGFEKYGPEMTVQQLGEQWRVDVCGTWGSSKEARLNMARGIAPADSGHPRYNRSWWTIGPQFSAEIYGLVAPGRPNLAAQLAREFGHINGYAEGVDGAVFVAGAVSLAFVESDPREIVRQAARLVHPDSPYRQCLDEIIVLADAGKSFEEIERRVIGRWAAEYPGTNNAVASGGLVALCLWFGDGDFLKTVNLACGASDFTDADCTAAGAAAVIGAMHGMKAIPRNLVDSLHDRVKGDKMGDLALPPVDESISGLGRRSAAFGEKLLLAHGSKLDGDTLVIARESVREQALERFTLANLTQYWSPGWTLERAGFGTTSGGKPGYGGTWLSGGVLTTWPRSEMRGVVLSKKLTIPTGIPHLVAEVGADPGRAWELAIFVGNTEVAKKSIIGGADKQIDWQTLDSDLTAHAGKEITLRLYQNLATDHPPSVAHWKRISVK